MIHFVWTDERIAKLKAWYFADVGPKEIARRFGVSNSLVNYHLDRLKIRRSKSEAVKNRIPRSWTPERLAELRAMVAAREGVSRTAVMTAVYRLDKRIPPNIRRENDRKIWSEGDLDAARRLRGRGLPLEEVAKRLGRSYSAVRGKIEPGDMISVRAPQFVIDERERRLELLSLRDTTGTLLGDPPPGYSALDRMRGQSA